MFRLNFRFSELISRKFSNNNPMWYFSIATVLITSSPPLLTKCYGWMPHKIYTIFQTASASKLNGKK